MRGVYLFYGEEGSGKSTHAKLLAQRLNLPYISSGDLLRKEESEHSEIGQLFAKREQAYLSDHLMIPFILNALSAKEYEGGFVIEGFPRNLNQLQKLEEFLKSKSLEIKKAFYVTLPEDIAVERLVKRGREDDTPEKIKERFRFYREHRKETLSHLKERGFLLEIDNQDSIDKVQEKIVWALDK